MENVEKESASTHDIKLNVYRFIAWFKSQRIHNNSTFNFCQHMEKHTNYWAWKMIFQQQQKNQRRDWI